MSTYSTFVRSFQNDPGAMIPVEPGDPQRVDAVDLFKPYLAFTNAPSASRDVRALDVRALCSTDINFSRA